MPKHLSPRKLAALAAAALLLLVYACSGGGSSPPGSQPTTEIPVPSPFPGITSEVVVPNADHPAALAFAPDGRLFYAEQNTGAVRIVAPDGQLNAKPFAQLEVAAGSGWGLLGLALDPDFETNHYVYLYFTQPVEERTARPVVVRFTEENNRGVGETRIIDDLPEATLFGEYAVGGQMRFGPDGYLYVTIGDHISTDFAQDLDSVRGKILRVNKADGSAAPDNPFVNSSTADPRVFAYGLLDAHDLAFHPTTGEMYVTENGTYFCCDEVNRVLAGQNFGWPQVGPEQGSVPPIHLFKLTENVTKVQPTGIEFVSGDTYPSLGDSLLTCEEVSKFMRRLVLAPARTSVQSEVVVVADCSLDIATSPDGIIYYSNGSEIRRLVEAGASP